MPETIDSTGTIDTAELVPFLMPSLGADMDEGSVVEWLVAPGATVHHGDIVAVVQTDKSDLDVEVFDDGTIEELVVPIGVKVPVGTLLARIRPAHGSQPSGAVAPKAAAAPVAEPAIEPAVEPASEPASEPVSEPAVATTAAPVRGHVAPPAIEHGDHVDHVFSPLLRHLAEQGHVDLGTVRGTGVGGRVTREDVELAIAARPARTTVRRLSPRARRLAREHHVDVESLAIGTVTGDDVLRAGATPTAAPALPTPTSAVAEPPKDRSPETPSATPAMDPMRLRIGRLMTKAWQEIPHYQVSSRIDLQAALAALAALNASRPVSARVLPAAAFARAAARAAAQVPDVNGHWIDGSFVPGDGVHLAVVVALRTGGLLAPVIHDAADKDLDSLMAEMRDLVTRARSGRLRTSEVTGATITITELGEGGVESVSPIIHPPQVAILGLGAVIDQPWAEHGMLGVRPVVHATLAGDHRAVDGRSGSLFLTRFARCLQEDLVP